MKYVLAFMFKEELKDYHFSLTKRISEEFRVRNVGDRIDPHITIKFLGELSENLFEGVEEGLEEVCSSSESFSIKVGRINRFNVGVVFLEVMESSEFRKFYLKVYDKLNKIEGLPKLDKFEGEKKYFHSSLAKKDIRFKIEDILKSLEGEDEIFEQIVDSVCILKFVEGHWDLHREFRFGI